MILYLHGFDATSTGNHEKIRQLQFIDKDVLLLSYSTLHLKHDMQYLLKEVSKQLQLWDDPEPIIIGVGLGIAMVKFGVWRFKRRSNLNLSFL